MKDENDPFYTHDDFGNPLDSETIARRQAWRKLCLLPPDEFFAHLVRIGIYNSDGTLAEPYCSTEPSAHRPTD